MWGVSCGSPLRIEMVARVKSVKGWIYSFFFFWVKRKVGFVKMEKTLL